MFSFCSHGAQECPDVNASQCSKKSEAETTALVEAEVAEAIASCGGDVRAALRATLIANAYLEAEIERLTEAISTGFARAGCARHLNGSRRFRGQRSCNDYD
jgi:hypothetical protein